MSAPSWDNFWRNTGKNTEMPCFGVQTDILRSQWKQLFDCVLVDLHKEARILDIAAGDGALISEISRYLSGVSLGKNIKLYAADYSSSACIESGRRVEGLKPVCCDSLRLPFQARSFDVIVSQFGIEYSGEEAFISAFETVKNSGSFISVSHMKHGSIYNECRENFLSTRAFLASGILDQARNVFSVADEVVSNRLDKQAFVDADRKFSIAVSSCKTVFDEFGANAGGGYLYQIYSELGHMFNQIHSYAGSDVITWLNNTEYEMEAYSNRMESMTDSALSHSNIESIQEKANKLLGSSCELRWDVRTIQGNPVAIPSEVNDDSDKIGWILHLRKLEK